MSQSLRHKFNKLVSRNGRFQLLVLIPSISLLLFICVWISARDDPPAWVQAIGSVAAILVAVGVAAWQRSSDRSDQQKLTDQQTRAVGILVIHDLRRALAEIRKKIEFADSVKVLPKMMSDGPDEFSIGLFQALDQVKSEWDRFIACPEPLQKFIYQVSEHNVACTREQLEWSRHEWNENQNNKLYAEKSLGRLSQLENCVLESIDIVESIIT